MTGFGEPAPGGRSHFSLPVFLGFAIAAAVVAAVAGIAGHMIHGTVTTGALSLLVALAIGYSGVAALLQPNVSDRRLQAGAGSFTRSLFDTLVREAGGRASFVIFALAARFDAPFLAGAGGAAGLMVSAAAVGLIDGAGPRPMPRKWIRIAGGAAFLLSAGLIALASRGLI